MMNKDNGDVILVVDDNPRNLQVIGALLTEWGYRPVIAQNALEGLRYIKEKQPDLVLMDVMMPDMNGFEACKKIKADDQIAHIPVIFITALNDSENIVKGFDSGGVDYITKPFIKEEVKARIQVHLRLKNAIERLENASITDEMTGVFNRRHAYMVLNREIKLARRQNRIFSVCYIDIDNLKTINDRFGHSKGDVMIIIVVEAFLSAARESDYMFRMGGDEFMLILPDTPVDEGENLINRIHKELAQTRIESFPIDFSFGLSVFDPASDWDAETLIRESDSQMYIQKNKKKKS